MRSGDGGGGRPQMGMSNIGLRAVLAALLILSCAPVGMARAASPPAAPEGFRTEDGNTQVRLRWSDPGDASIAGWQYARRLSWGSFGAWRTIPGGTAATTTHTVTGLTNYFTYYFRIRAVNAHGAGAASEERSGEPWPAPAARPTGFRAIAGDGEVTLRWDDPDDASIRAWQYRQRRADGAWGYWRNMPGSGAGTVQHVVTGLANGETWVFRIRATNNAGNGYESDEASATPAAARPAAPTGFSATAGDGEATLRWDDPGDAGITGWRYQQRLSDAAWGEEWTPIPGSGAGTTHYRVTGLANGVRYIFRIRAVNASGPGPASAEVSATPMLAVPAEPTGLSATAGDGQVTLRWDDPGNAGITGWRYRYRSTGGWGAWTAIPESGPATARHTVAGLANGVAHAFQLRAVNAAGAGPASAEVSATPLAVPAGPTGLTAEAGDGRATLRWDDPGDASITGWQYAWRTDAGYGAWTAISGSDAATARHTVAGLANGVAHVFRIRAVNASGPGPASEEASATPLAVPGKPAGFAVRAGSGLLRLSWSDPQDAGIAGWQYAFRSVAEESGWRDIPESGPATAGHILRGLLNGLAHHVRIRAVNASGPGPASDELTATPLAAVPPKPTGLSATAGDGRAVLEWDDPDDPSIAAWQLRRKRAEAPWDARWTTMAGSDWTTRRHDIAGLENGVAYRFRIRAVNRVGNGPESEEVVATPQPPPPAEPTGLEALAGDGQVALSWDDPGDATITAWQYAWRTEEAAPGPWRAIAPSDATTARHTVTGLKNGETYRFRIRALNGGGPGPASAEAAATPMLAVPARPTGLTATAGDEQATLRWPDPGNASITGWQYQHRLSDAAWGNGWSTIPGSAARTTSHTITGLTNGESYSFRIRAVNASGPGPASDETTATPLAAPAKPKGLSATAGDGRVLLQWSDPNDTSITGWQYQQRLPDATWGQDWNPIPDSGAGTTSHTVSDLTNGVAHVFRIRAVNASDAGPVSEEVAATPLAVPTKPTGLTAAAGDGQVTLQWTAPDNASITGWQYQHRLSGEDWSEDWNAIPGSPASTTSHTVSGLANGKSYSFRIRAVNAGGLGPASDEATATPLPIPARPNGLSATPGDGQVLLQWTDPDNASITAWQYQQRLPDAAWSEEWTAIPDSGASTTSHTVNGLENGATYGFRIRAANASGLGGASAEALATLRAALARPAGLSATPDRGQVLLRWSDPGNPDIVGWQYQFRRAGAAWGEDWTHIAGSDAATVSHAVAGLRKGVTYGFRLRAVTHTSAGPASAEVMAAPLATPDAPTGLTATAGDGQALLRWDDPDDPGIVEWQYQRRLPDAAWGEDWIPMAGSAAATTRHTVVGLANSVTYGFRLRAANASGPGPASAEAVATPLAALARPTGLVASAGRGQVLLQWSDPGNPGISGWQYQYRRAGAGWSADWTHIADSDSATTRHSVAGLRRGVTYGFRLRAVTQTSVGPASAEVMAAPLATPDAPIGVAATAGDGEVLLRWDGPDERGVTAWQYQQRLLGADWREDWIVIPGSAAATAAHTVTGLENGVTYGFRLRAENASGPGPASTEAIATPLAAPARPTGLTAAASDGRVLLQWADPGNPGVTGWQYQYRRAGAAWGQDWIHILGSAADTTRHTVTGLENGATHGFRIRAVTGTSAGPPSEERSATPQAFLPDAPQGLTAAPGDGRVTLEWLDLRNASVIAWQYSARTVGPHGPWTDMPPSTATRHTVTGLVNETRYHFRIRALAAGGPGPPSVEVAATPEAAAPERPTGLAAEPGDGRVLLTWRDPGNPAITSWQYAAWTTDGAGRTPDTDAWRDIAGSDAATARHAVEALVNGALYGFQLRAMRGGLAGPGSAVVEARPRAAARPAEKRLVELALTGLAGRVAAGAAAAIGARFPAAPAERRLRLAGQEVRPPPSDLGRGPAPVASGARRIDLAELLRTTEIDGGRWSVWGQSSLSDFEGRDAAGAPYGGAVQASHVGVDLRFADGWLAGLAVAETESELEYAAGDAAGRMAVRLRSWHPYLRRQLPDGGQAWLALGRGRGALDAALSGREPESARLSLTMASAGLSRPWREAGRLKLDATAEGGLLQLEADGPARTAAGGASAFADRQSLGLEARLEGDTLSGFASARLRRNSGAFGLRLAGGVRLARPAAGESLDLRGHWLEERSGRAYREYGLSATAALAPARSGLRLALAASHGAPARGSEPLWGEPAEQAAPRPASLAGRLGWRLRRSALTPFAAATDDGAGRRFALGVEVPAYLELLAERRLPDAGPTETRIAARLQLRF